MKEMRFVVNIERARTETLEERRQRRAEKILNVVFTALVSCAVLFCIALYVHAVWGG